VVRQGDVLVRLDTERIDNEIIKRKRTIEAGKEELDKGAHMEELLGKQFEAAKDKGEAELAQARKKCGKPRNAGLPTSASPSWS